jgi:hypothetical protein
VEQHLMRKFVKILRVELEDLQDDLKLLVDGHREQFARNEITEHVCLENIGTLRSEELGVAHFLRELDQVDTGGFNDLDALVEHVKQAFKGDIARSGLARAAYFLAELKIKRVARYVRDTTRPGS